MFQKRMLLLGASLVAFGAITIGGAFAFGTFTDTDIIGPTTVVAPTNNVVLDPIGASAEIANNQYQLISAISSSKTDPNYDYRLTNLAITSQGSAANCGTYDYAMDGPATVVPGAPFIGGVINGASIPSGYSMYIRIDPVGTLLSCTVSGAVLEATYTVGF